MDEEKQNNSTNVVEFIPRETWEKQFAVESQKEGKLSLPRELNRKRVVSAFMDAFELVGGVPRLVEWAAQDENYGDFLKLYARLLPSQASSDLEPAAERVIKHVLPRSKLDE